MLDIIAYESTDIFTMAISCVTQQIVSYHRTKKNKTSARDNSLPAIYKCGFGSHRV